VEVTPQLAAPPPLRPQDRVAAGLAPDIAGQRVGELDPERLHGRSTLGPEGVRQTAPALGGWYWIVGAALAEPFAPHPLEWPAEGTKRPISKIPPMLEDDLWSKLTEEQAPADWTVKVLEASPGVLDVDAGLPLPLKSLAATQALEAIAQATLAPEPERAASSPAEATPEAEVFATRSTGELERLEQSVAELPSPRDVPVDDGEFLSWGEEVFALAERPPDAGGDVEVSSARPDPALERPPVRVLDALAAVDTGGEFALATLPGATDDADEEVEVEPTQPGTPSPFAPEDAGADSTDRPALAPWEPASAELSALEHSSTDDTTPGVQSPFLDADAGVAVVTQESPPPEPAAGPFAALLAGSAAALSPAAVEREAGDGGDRAEARAPGHDDARGFDLSSDVITTRPAAPPPAAPPAATTPATDAQAAPSGGVLGRLKRLFGGNG
jgi:hypothetical protein